MAVINAKRSLACNSRLLGKKLHQYAARAAPAQSNERDFQFQRSEIAELRPGEQRPGRAGSQSEARDPETQSRVVQRVSPLSGQRQLCALRQCFALCALRSAYWLLAQPLRLRALLAAGALVAYVHPKFDFKKHGNGIHPPTCFLFKCVSKVRSVNTMASLLSVSGEIA
jgi:hypothetical protein